MSTFASDIEKIAGRYKYESYTIELPNGYKVGLEALGARSVEIEFRKDYSIVMFMAMLDGKVVESKATIKEIKIDNGKGYWLAQWPEMDYPVKKEFQFSGDTFEYYIKFENQHDTLRYGSVERAILKKIKTF
jgi:hypothetical protein